MTRPGGFSGWRDRFAAALLVLAGVLLLLPGATRVRLLAPAGAVLLAPNRGLIALTSTFRNWRAENERLSALAADLTIDNARLLSLAQAAGPIPDVNLPLVRATVIARDLGTFRRYLIIARGAGDGIRPGNAALVADGVVGKVVTVGGHQSLVQTLYATDSRASVMSRRTRVPALLRADPDGRLLLDYVPKESEFAVNDTLVTAGLGGVFPRGIRVGRVVSAPAPGSALFRKVEVEPFAAIATIPEVFIITIPDSLAAAARRDWPENAAPTEVAIPEENE